MDVNANPIKQRFPDLGNLSVAILESLVEKVIGRSAIEEVKKPHAQRQIAAALANALSNVEKGFLKQHPDQDICSALIQLPIHSLPSAQTAIWAFYERPNDTQFSEVLTKQLKAIGIFSKLQIDHAVVLYLKLLKRELVNIDSELREKIQALTLLDITDTLSEMKKFIQRNNEPKIHQTPPRREKRENVQLILDGNFDEFDEMRQKEIIGVLATLLHLNANSIRILKVSRGSVILDLEMEKSAIELLVALLRKRDLRIQTLGILAVRLSSGETIVFEDTTAHDPPMKATLKRISETDRAILIMRYWYDYSETEIAESLKLTISEVKRRLDTTRRELARLWQDNLEGEVQATQTEWEPDAQGFSEILLALIYEEQKKSGLSDDFGVQRREQ